MLLQFYFLEREAETPKSVTENHSKQFWNVPCGDNFSQFLRCIKAKRKPKWKRKRFLNKKCKCKHYVTSNATSKEARKHKQYGQKKLTKNCFHQINDIQYTLHTLRNFLNKTNTIVTGTNYNLKSKLCRTLPNKTP